MKKRGRKKVASTGTGQALIGGILVTIDISTAILLLTGQISATGVFVQADGGPNQTDGSTR